MELDPKITSFEDQPLPVHQQEKDGQNQLSEYLDGQNPEVQNVQITEKQPLAIRLKSKVFKVKSEALNELTNCFLECQTGDGPLIEYIEDLSNLMSDSHPQCQEKSLKAFEIWIERVKDISAIDINAVLKTLTEKCFPSPKQQIVSTANEIIFLLFEKGLKKEIFAIILAQINSKNNKVQINTISLLRLLLENFGIHHLDYLKPFLPEMEKLTQNTVTSLKKECYKFYAECFKWLGENIKALFVNFKPQQAQEIEKSFEPNPEGMPQPKRPWALQQQTMNQQTAICLSDLIVDPYETCQAVDIFNKYHEQKCDQILAQKKWSEKKQSLDELIKDASVPKLANTKFDHVVVMIKKLINDSNVSVCSSAIKIAGLLANGLRKSLARHAKILLTPLYLKLKDKKGPVCDEALKALKLYLHCVKIEVLLEEIKVCLSDKQNVQWKANALTHLDQLLDAYNPKVYNWVAPIKGFILSTKQMFEDGALEIREKYFIFVVKSYQKLGDQAIGNLKSLVSKRIVDRLESTISTGQIPQSQGDLIRAKSIPIKKQDKIDIGITNPLQFVDCAAPLQREGVKTPKVAQPSAQNSNAAQNAIPPTFNNPKVSIKEEKPNVQINVSFYQKLLAKLSEPNIQSSKEAFMEFEQNVSILPEIEGQTLVDILHLLKQKLANLSLRKCSLFMINKLLDVTGQSQKLYFKDLVYLILDLTLDSPSILRSDIFSVTDKICEQANCHDKILMNLIQNSKRLTQDIKHEYLNLILKTFFKIDKDLMRFNLPFIIQNYENSHLKTITSKLIEKFLQQVPLEDIITQIQCLDFKNNLKEQTSEQVIKLAESLGFKADKNMKSRSYAIELQAHQNHNRTSKMGRLNEDVASKHWVQGDIDDEQIRQLKDDFIQNGLHPELMKLMFSYNYINIINATEKLKVGLKKFSDNSDLLIKYTLFQMYNFTNQLKVSKMFEFTIFYLGRFDQEKLHLSEYEVDVLLHAIQLYIFQSCSELETKLPQFVQNISMIKTILERLAKVMYNPTKIVVYFFPCFAEDNSPTTIQTILNILLSLFKREFSQEIKNFCKIQGVTTNQDIIQVLKQYFEESYLRMSDFHLNADQPDTLSNMSTRLPEEQLSVHTGRIRSGIHSEITAGFTGLNDLMIKNIAFFVENLETIFQAYAYYLSFFFKATNRHRVPLFLLNHGFQMMQKLVTSEFLARISIGTLTFFVDSMFQCLIAEDEFKIEYHDVMLKALNSLTLKVLENTYWPVLQEVLFSLLAMAKKNGNNKLKNLAIRGVIKLFRINYDRPVQPGDYEKVFKKINEYLQMLEGDQDRELGRKSIIVLLQEVLKNPHSNICQFLIKNPESFPLVYDLFQECLALDTKPATQEEIKLENKPSLLMNLNNFKNLFFKLKLLNNQGLNTYISQLEQYTNQTNQDSFLEYLTNCVDSAIVKDSLSEQEKEEFDAIMNVYNQRKTFVSRSALKEISKSVTQEQLPNNPIPGSQLDIFQRRFKKIVQDKPTKEQN